MGTRRQGKPVLIRHRAMTLRPRATATIGPRAEDPPSMLVIPLIWWCSTVQDCSCGDSYFWPKAAYTDTRSRTLARLYTRTSASLNFSCIPLSWLRVPIYCHLFLDVREKPNYKNPTTPAMPQPTLGHTFAKASHPTATPRPAHTRSYVVLVTRFGNFAVNARPVLMPVSTYA